MRQGLTRPGPEQRGSTRGRGWLRLLVPFFLLALIATACGSDDSSSSTSSSGGAASGSSESSGGGGDAGKGIKVGLVFDIGGRGDKSFNDSAYAGLEKAQQELGVEIQALSPSAGGENREELLRTLADTGHTLIIGVGFAFADGIKAVAADFPDIKFAIVDDSSVEAPNVSSLVFAEEQGSYLMGVAAALQSKTGHIGFVGGVETDLIKKFDAGYAAGAKSVKADIVIDRKYISQPPDFSGFADAAKGKEAAAKMYQDGADVVFHAAGATGVGVFNAAKEASAGGTQKWAIGVDSDQYQSVGDPSLQPFILTSMLKQVDTAVFGAISEFVAGDLKAGVERFNLDNDGIGFATSGGFITAYETQLNDTAKKIADGTITVPTAP